MARQSFTASDIADFPPASHTAVANTTTRTNLWVPALWSPIAAYDMKPGKAYILRAGGIVSTTAGSQNLTVNPTFGQSATPSSNVALGSAVVACGGSLSSAPWYAEFVMGCRQVGIAASGATVTGNGYFLVKDGTSTPFYVLGGTVATTADHTTAQGLCLDVTWASASASNTITAQWTTLQSLN